MKISVHLRKSAAKFLVFLFIYNYLAMRTDWTRPEISALYHQPLLDLLWNAQQVHREFHPANQVQMCRLLSIKTGGCPEDCAYCPQSARYSAGVERQALMPTDEIVAAAQTAKS